MSWGVACVYLTHFPSFSKNSPKYTLVDQDLILHSGPKKYISSPPNLINFQMQLVSG